MNATYPIKTNVWNKFFLTLLALPLGMIDEVFGEVESGAADFGVVPIENSTEGTVNNTLDRFLSTSLHICGEVELRIHHNLMGRMTALGEVQRAVALAGDGGTYGTRPVDFSPPPEGVAVGAAALGGVCVEEGRGVAVGVGLVLVEGLEGRRVGSSLVRGASISSTWCPVAMVAWSN